jgi:NADH:ubiquinone oxidoreductase subunit 5 (subunit L)/multisubunit Na+/H+ antiporter MnhA subunit
MEMALHGFVTAPFWLALAGVVLAWYLYLKRPDLPAAIAARMKGVHELLLNKYYIDEIYAFLFRDGLRKLGLTPPPEIPAPAPSAQLRPDRHARNWCGPSPSGCVR